MRVVNDCAFSKRLALRRRFRKCEKIGPKIGSLKAKPLPSRPTQVPLSIFVKG